MRLFPTLDPRLFPIHQPLVLQAFSAEIDEQAGFQVECLEVIKGLSQMNILQAGDGLDFQEHPLLDKKIHAP